MMEVYGKCSPKGWWRKKRGKKRGTRIEEIQEKGLFQGNHTRGD